MRWNCSFYASDTAISAAISKRLLANKGTPLLYLHLYIPVEFATKMHCKRYFISCCAHYLNPKFDFNLYCKIKFLFPNRFARRRLIVPEGLKCNSGFNNCVCGWIMWGTRRDVWSSKSLHTSEGSGNPEQRKPDELGSSRAD